MPKFTDASVRAASAGIHWDDSLAGFGLRVGKKTKTFIVLVSSGRRHSIGHYPRTSLADARKEAKRILAEKELGKVRPTHVAWDDAKAEYLAVCAKKNKPSTLDDYTKILALHFPPDA